jgi:hypothetical protein
VKPPTDWRKSSFCGNGACVEVALVGDEILVRDGKNPLCTPALRFTRSEWAAFLRGAKNGEFDPA